MASTSSNPTTMSALLGNLTSVQQALSSSSGILALVQTEAQTLANQNPSRTDVFSLQNKTSAPRLILAGDQKIESAFHRTLAQGAFLETQIGDAMSWVMAKKLDYEEKIQHYLSLNRLAVDGKLSDIPRGVKYAADSVKFIQQIRDYTNDILMLIQVLQTNLVLLRQVENQMLGMIQGNMNALANLLQEICNWNLPPLPSMLAQIGSLWHWNGFNFNSIANFKFNPNLSFNFNFSFSQCALRTPDLSAFFNTPATQVYDGNLALSAAQPTLPSGASYADPAQYSIPAYISQMQSTTTAIYDPNLVETSSTSSLPSPSSIVSNYALPPATYAANVISAVPDLASVVIQPSDADYNTSPSASRTATLRSLCIRSINLAGIVASEYDPNLTAAWLFYLDLNRTGRAGTWLANFEQEYTSVITPSVNYLKTTPVPWNKVLGGSGISDAPAAIPLTVSLKADTTNDLKWRLSFIEAALLGYARNTTWDAAADSTYTDTFSGTNLDYVPTTVNATPTNTVILGATTAQYPVSCTFPQSIAGVLAEVIALAAIHIEGAPSYQSTRPQFRYTYDMFAQATLVDRFSQFWREFNANLVTLLAQDPYLVAFVATYPALLDSAIDPLADPTLYENVQIDVSARNRTWTPGVNGLPIPKALQLTAPYTLATDSTNGWTNGSLDSTAYLARPDVQAQSVSTQIAMLRTNQSYANLATLTGSLQQAVSTAIANAQTATQSGTMPGWEVETMEGNAVPPGTTGLVMSFDKVDFDQTGYVEDMQTIEIPAANAYLLAVELDWDPTGASGTRTLNVLLNGEVLATVSADNTTATPYTLQYADEVNLNQGDILQVQAVHSLSSAQTVLTGSYFLGLLDLGGEGVISMSNPPTGGTGATGGSGTGNVNGTAQFMAGTAFPAFTAVAQATDGNVYPVNPTLTVVGNPVPVSPQITGSIPFVDGVATQVASAAGVPISVQVVYGSIFSDPSANWTEGELLYVAADGSLTQDYASLTTSVHWIVCVGKAISKTTAIFAPHLPSNIIQNF